MLLNRIQKTYILLVGILFPVLLGCGSDPVRKGRTALALGDYVMAKSFFAGRLQQKPDCYPARLGMGKALIQEAAALATDSSWRRALTHLEAARTINPQSPEVIELLGEAWSVHARNRLESGDTLQALSALGKAIEYSPFSVEPLNLAGIVYYRLGDPDKAVTLFRKAIAVDSSNASAYFNLGMVYWQQNNHQMAHTQWLHALENDPADDDIVYWFALAEKSLHQQGAQ